MTSLPRVVLVTGASSGIGEATAVQAAERGDHLILLARGADSLDRVGERCQRAGAASVLCLPTDVRDDAAVRKAVEEAVAEHGRLDIVVSNAGVVAYGRLEDVPTEVFDAVLDTNLHGSVNLVRHVLPVLRAQQRGSLVFVGSLIGHITVPGMSAYVLSKWGVRGLARQVRTENHDLSGVRIAYVAPGGVDTPIYDQAANYGASAGRPPFPVTTPERVAARVLKVADHPGWRSQIGLGNDAIRLGFTTLPWLYDILVGPLVEVMARDLTKPVVQGAGNVLTTQEEGNALRGGWPNALLGVARNLVVVARRGVAT